VPRSPDLVATSVSAQLMETTGSTATQVSEKVLVQPVERFDSDAGFPRHHDHDIRAWVLVAESPKRINVPDPDPVVVVHFSSADPVLARCERGRKPVVILGEQASRTLPRWLSGGEVPPSPSIAAAPLVSGEVTTGVFGFVKSGIGRWKFLLFRPVPDDARQALLTARWMPMPFLADRKALSTGAI
jgi:diguanylate cyclase